MSKGAQSFKDSTEFDLKNAKSKVFLSLSNQSSLLSYTSSIKNITNSCLLAIDIKSK